MIEELLRAKQVQIILNVSLPMVYKLADRGQLPCVRWDCPGEGGRKKTTVRFLKQDILNFIKKHKRN